MDRTMRAWHIQEEEFGSSISGYRVNTLEYFMGIANTEDEVKSYIDAKYGKDPVRRMLVFFHEIEIHQLTIDEIGELRLSKETVIKNE